MPCGRFFGTPVESRMPKPRARSAGRAPAQSPSQRAANRSDGEQRGNRMLLHGTAYGLSPLPVILLRLRHIAPAPLQIGPTSLVKVTSRIGCLLGR